MHARRVTEPLASGARLGWFSKRAEFKFSARLLNEPSLVRSKLLIGA